jgi:hypothetical protein
MELALKRNGQEMLKFVRALPRTGVAVTQTYTKGSGPAPKSAIRYKLVDITLCNGLSCWLRHKAAGSDSTEKFSVQIQSSMRAVYLICCGCQGGGGCGFGSADLQLRVQLVPTQILIVAFFSFGFLKFCFC